jgi:hypothetical protein
VNAFRGSAGSLGATSETSSVRSGARDDLASDIVTIAPALAVSSPPLQLR